MLNGQLYLNTFRIEVVMSHYPSTYFSHYLLSFLNNYLLKRYYVPGTVWDISSVDISNISTLA